LIDVREPYEFEIANIGGTLIPKGEILKHLEKIDPHKDVASFADPENAARMSLICSKRNMA
jgi:adenylyltransferase/sulfurtransferase